MQSSNYTDSNVLLFDRTGAVLRQTMSVLKALGFKSFLDVQELTAARQVLTNQRLEIVILALESADCGVLKLVDDIRKQRCGPDPFIPILLTAWDARLKSVRAVIDSGVDDFLLHPFSITQMSKRIEALVNARKPFVVTGDYFGPDRRAAPAIQADLSSIVVPNALQARARDRRDTAAGPASFEAVFSDLQWLKLRNLSRRIWYLANRLKQSLPEPSPPHRYEDDLTKIRSSIRMYQNTLLPVGDEILAKLCESLSDVLARLFGLPPDAGRLKLLEKNALALRVASKLENEQSDSGEVVRGEEVAKTGKAEAELIQAVMG